MVTIRKYDSGIYPRALWTCHGDCLKQIKKRFELADKSPWGDIESFKNVNAWTLHVIDKRNGELGYIIWLKDRYDIRTVVHEAGHVALHIMQDIACNDIMTEQEPFCYLLEWITTCAMEEFNLANKENE